LVGCVRLGGTNEGGWLYCAFGKFELNGVGGKPGILEFVGPKFVC
jgi:hypothetical protein